MLDFSLISKFRNREQCETLIKGIQDKWKTCYNFFDIPADPNAPEANPEDQMKAFESTQNFYDNDHFKKMFEMDLNGMKEAKKVIVLLPAGNSTHIEAGIAYGMGKPLILIWEAEKAESHYLIFNERYKTIDDFLQSI